MDRRKFLSYVGCGCCGFVINACSTAPITDRRQFKIIPEAKLNAQAAKIYEKVKEMYLKMRDAYYKVYRLNEITNKNAIKMLTTTQRNKRQPDIVHLPINPCTLLFACGLKLKNDSWPLFQ